MNHDVFISYSSRNKQTALAICHVLEGHGVRCWMAPRDIPPGADYGDVIDEAIVPAFRAGLLGTGVALAVGEG